MQSRHRVTVEARACRWPHGGRHPFSIKPAFRRPGAWATIRWRPDLADRQRSRDERGGGKVVTFGDKTHVVWQDSTKQGYFNRVRSPDHATGEWSETFTLNQGRDNHARPVITVDHNG